VTHYKKIPTTKWREGHATMNDIYDIITFVLFGGIVAVTVQVVVTLGTLPVAIRMKKWL
jgi:hypothetical protein